MENTSEKSWYKASEIQLVYKSKVLTSQSLLLKVLRMPVEYSEKPGKMKTLIFWSNSKCCCSTEANKVLGIVEISKGGTAGTVVDPKIVFAAAIKTNCSALILAHYVK
jgi:DNA repair protein RadC